MTGNNYWLVVAPIVFFGTLVFWVGLVLYANFHLRRFGPHQDVFKRGPVSGGVIEGSPAQLTRRDEARRSDQRERSE